MPSVSPPSNSQAFQELIRHYSWIHTTLGLIGNTCFFIGSILFLLEFHDIAVWLYISGSFGMLVGSLGDAIIKAEEWS